MPEKYKTYEGGLFFVTLTVVGWIDIFTRRIYSDLIIDNLNFCISNKGLEVYSYVIMPSHLHMVASVNEGLLTSDLRDFKSYASLQIIKSIKENPKECRLVWLLFMFEWYGKRNNHNVNYQFWIQNNHPIDLFSHQITKQKVEYIHQNPVVAGIVSEPEHYVYSSAHPFNRLRLEAL